MNVMSAELIYYRCNTLPDRLACLGCSEVVHIGSAYSPGLTCLGVNDEYSEVVISGGAALVSSWVVVIATNCPNCQYQAQRQQKANDQTGEVQVPIEPLLFMFHNCNSLDFIVDIRRRNLQSYCLGGSCSNFF
jgi:hypothetical protein